MKSTITTQLYFIAASLIAFASSRDIAMGFSTIICLPRFKKCKAISECEEGGVEIRTASNSVSISRCFQFRTKLI